MSGKKYFAALGQFYATTSAPLRPFLHWPQWARDAYWDALTAQRQGNPLKRYSHDDQPASGGADHVG